MRRLLFSGPRIEVPIQKDDTVLADGVPATIIAINGNDEFVVQYSNGDRGVFPGAHLSAEYDRYAPFAARDVVMQTGGL